MLYFQRKRANIKDNPPFGLKIIGTLSLKSFRRAVEILHQYFKLYFLLESIKVSTHLICRRSKLNDFKEEQFNGESFECWKYSYYIINYFKEANNYTFSQKYVKFLHPKKAKYKFWKEFNFKPFKTILNKIKINNVTFLQKGFNYLIEETFM